MNRLVIHTLLYRLSVKCGSEGTNPGKMGDEIARLCWILLGIGLGVRFSFGVRVNYIVYLQEFGCNAC